MGDSAPQDRRRYARPGEFEIPNSVLETNSFKQRLGGELNAERKSPAPVSRELRPSGDLSPIPAKPGPPTVEPPLSANLNQYRGNPIPVSRELRPGGGLSHSRTSPNPMKFEAGLNTDLNQQRANAFSISREPRLSGELNPTRRNSIPTVSEVGLKADLHQQRRNPAPLTDREAIGRRRVPARFELLPEPQSKWNRIGLSAALQLAFLGFLLLSPIIFPQQMETAFKFDVVELMQPVTNI